MMATIDSTTSSATAAAAVTIKADNQGVLVSPSTLSSTNTDNTKKHDGVATAALTDVEVEGDVNADTTKKTPAPAVQATTTPLVMEKEKQHVDTTSTKSTAVTLITTTTTTTTTTTKEDHRSSSTSLPIIQENEIITSTLNDMDVVCGRGKGIRNHPGNILYNKLLRERYEEYGTAPKGSKLSIVNIVVNTIRNQQQLNGGGRFLEQKQQVDSNSLEDSDVYIDIGDVRALNKTVSTYLY
jgi:hypothetical protein